MDYLKNINHMELFDVIILGAGSGGLTVASFMNRIGMRVLLVDRSRGQIGGDCLNTGCVPSKSLIHIARKINQARNAKTYGLSLKGEVNMLNVKEDILATQSLFREHENPEYLQQQGITIALGEAVFTGKNTICVGAVEYAGKKIIIATGSRPRPYALPGIELHEIYTNETIFTIEFLPKNLVLIGGGPISLEIGQAFAYLGSQVTIVHSNDEILQKEDKEVARRIREKLSSQGMIFHCNTTPLRVQNKNELIVSDGKAESTISFDVLFAATGRIPNIDKLNLEKANIAVQNGHLIIDEYLRTTNPKVYACGDTAGAYQFTHVAELHASLLLHNFFSPLKQKINYKHISWVTYTDPEVATFGLSEGELQKDVIAYKIIEKEFSNDDRAVIDGYQNNGYVKLLLSHKGTLLGGTMVAPNAGELIQELTLICMQKIPLSVLSQKIYPYPTASRINRRVSLEYRSRLLTPTRIKILRMLFNLQ